MRKKTQLLFLILGMSNICVAQYKDSLMSYDCGDNRYSPISSNGPEDTTSAFFGYYFNTYENGKRLEKIYLNDSLWLDTLLRFHFDGNLAYKGVILNRTPIIDKIYRNVSYLFDENIQSFYENGNIRSREFHGYYPEKYKVENSLFFFKQFFDTNSDLIYSEILLFNDTIEGTFLKDWKDEYQTYVVYENGKLIEIWTIKNGNSQSPIIIEIKCHLKNKVINKSRKIKNKLKRTPLVSFNCSLYVSNGSGRSLSNSIMPIIN
jgi:antitoxin component YwqK of YwqJK toxin-antitoxin module